MENVLALLNPLAALPNSRRFFVNNLLRGVTPLRREPHRFWSSIYG
jgi:hypothetical protein